MRARRAALAVVTLGALAASACGRPRDLCDAAPPSAGAMGCVDGFANPEDVAFVPTQSVLLVSEMAGEGRGGGIALLRLGPDGAPIDWKPVRIWPGGITARDGAGDEGCRPPDEARDFHPHGLDVGPRERDGSVPVYVVDHGRGETIERFALRDEVLTWRGCWRMPPDASGNDVAVGPDGRVAVSDYQPTQEGPASAWYAVMSGLGFDTGSIYVRGVDVDGDAAHEDEWTELAGSEAVAPNGVLWAADGRSVWFAETGRGVVRRVHLDGSPEPEPVRVSGFPDNVSRDGDRILVVSHDFGLAVLLCRMGLLPCRSPWSLRAFRPGDAEAAPLLQHPGDQIGGAASAAVAGDWTYIGAIFDDRIGLWRPGEDGAAVLQPSR